MDFFLYMSMILTICKVLITCNLRRPVATDAVTNGHPAVINGHLVRPCFRVTES